MNTIFNREQFEFTEIFIAVHGEDFENVDTMFIAVKDAWLDFKPNRLTSFYEQAADYLCNC